jgi:hypothetical protein
MLNFGNQFPFRILFRILSVVVVNCNLIISVMVAWPIKYTKGSKPGKKHTLPIDLSKENKTAKRSAYEKERQPGLFFSFNVRRDLCAGVSVVFFQALCTSQASKCPLLFSWSVIVLSLKSEGSKSGKKHPLPIDLSTENKKPKRSAYEKERRPGRSFNQKWKDKMNNPEWELVPEI